MGVVSELCKGFEIPKMIKIRQCFPRPKIEREDIHSVIFNKLEQEKFVNVIKPGMRVAITAGSRGISNIALIIHSLVEWVKSKGGDPFIVPAMGSHGGATAEGQLEVLHGYGITEEYLGCPILSSMETVHIGDTCEGHHVRIDKNAYEADGIIVAGRIKPHTGFRGPYESGIMKMMTIGLGKQEGAEVCHATGFGEMGHLVPLFGNVILEKANILMGFAIIENAYDETCVLEPLAVDEIPSREPELLNKARDLMPRILFDSVDVLVIDKIGKNFSGDGHDPNISGRFITPYATGGIESQRMVVLDLSDESHGNACGVGLADIITQRLKDKIDLEMTYPNVITSTVLKAANIPVTVDNDVDAIKLAIRTCTKGDRTNPKIVRIPNTLHIEHILISEALLEKAKENPNIVVEGVPEEMDFDANGNLVDI